MKNKDKHSNLSKYFRFLEVLPVVVPVLFALFGTLAVFLLIFGKLNSIFVLILACPLLLVASIVIYKKIDLSNRPGSLVEKNITDGLILVFILMWCLVNLFYTSQNVYVFRDPGIYTITAKFITKNNNLNYVVENPFGKPSSVIKSDSPGFMAKDDQENPKKYPQGMHVFPALVGLVGRLVGDNGIFKFNIVVAGVALLSVYAFSRMLVKPRWAALATVALSIMYPFIYFSRDNYTEILSIVFVFGALSMLWVVEEKSSKLLWICTGIILGASTLNRVDGLLVVIPALAYAFILLYKETEKVKLRRLLTRTTLMLMAASFVIFISWIDLKYLSSQYYSVHGKQFYQLLAVIIGVFLLGSTLLLATKLKKRSIDKFFSRNKKALAWLTIFLFLAIASLLISRPLWHISRDSSMRPFAQNAIENLQLTLGYNSDPTRDYAENSIKWVIWYTGSVIGILGLIGVVVCINEIFVKQRVKLIPFLSLVVFASLLFFIKPGIIPDHIWASRRFLIMTIPGLVILAAVSLNRLSEIKKIPVTLRSAFLVLLSALVLLGPLTVTGILFSQRLNASQLSQIDDICSSLPENSAILWLGEKGSIGIQAIREYCNKPALYALKISSKDLSESFVNAKQSGYVPILLISKEEEKLLHDNGVKLKTKVISEINYKELERTLLDYPKSVNYKKSTIIMGVIE